MTLGTNRKQLIAECRRRLLLLSATPDAAKRHAERFGRMLQYFRQNPEEGGGVVGDVVRFSNYFFQKRLGQARTRGELMAVLDNAPPDALRMPVDKLQVQEVSEERLAALVSEVHKRLPEAVASGRVDLMEDFF